MPETVVSELIELHCSQVEISIDAAPADTDAMPSFSMIAYTGDAMRVAAMKHPVVVDLEGHACNFLLLQRGRLGR